MKLSFFLLLLSISFSVFGQNEKKNISFFPTLNNELIEINKEYFSQSIDDSINFEAIRFYISDIELFQDDDLIFSLEKKHHLIDLETPESLKMDFEIKQDLKFNKIKFNLGVDSLTNVGGAMGGDLDPSNGMYWTWQSGYINFKLEGITASCPARHHFFQYHLGGFQSPYNSLQTIELPLFNTDSKSIKINLAIDDFFKNINIKETYEVMSPSQRATDLTELIASMFSISK